MTAKVLARDALATILHDLRKQGRRITLVNGVFDLLHVGHVRALQEAARLGDVLVVALNDDASTRRLKGPSRPVQTAADRAEILAAFGCVDYVTTFGEESAAATLEALQPAVHAKGADYRPEDIPALERDVARRLGIELALVGGPKLGSSRELRERLGAAEPE